MKLFLKAIGFLFAVLVVVAAAGAIMLATFDPNEHKDRVAAIVKDATGRDLAIEGNIEVSYFPVLGFEAEGVRLSNPEGFPDETFMNVGRVSAGVKVLPLLARNLEFSKITLWEPHIDIIKQADGTTNLQLPARQADQQAGADRQEFTVEAIDVSDGSLTYTDKATGRQFAAEPLNLSLPGYAPGEDMDFSLEAVIRQAASPVAIEADIDATVNAEPQSGIYVFRDIEGEVNLSSRPAAREAAEGGETPGGEAAAAQRVAIGLSGNVQANLKAEDVAINNLRVSWNDSLAQGKANIKGFSPPVVNFNLTSPVLDLDALGVGGGGGGGGNQQAESDGILPVNVLRDLTVEGAVAVDELRVAGVRASNFRADVAGENGVIVVDPLRANVYGGTEQARLRIDVRSPVPGFTVAGTVEGMQAGDLIREATGEEYVSGVFNANYDLTAAGNTARALRETAGGTIGVNFTEGVIQKWQLSALINQALPFFRSGRTNEECLTL